MQARIEFRRSKSTLVSFVLVTLMALVLGGALGYAIKPSTVTGGSTHTIFVPAGQVSNASDIACQWVGQHKAC